jgi:G3E family GTPase
MSLPPKVNIEYARALLLRKEKLVKPASVAMRHQIIQAQNRSAYMNEYDRIQGIISGYADRFAGKHNIQRLKNRQSDLRRLFKESHEHNHPIQGKSDRKPFSVSSQQSITSSELRRI